MKQDHGTGSPPRVARRGNRISLCMIVRDEEQYLAQCLDSVLGVADEIVVVDTGSEDGTVAIAESHDAKVVHFAWTEHFAEARNQAIAAATDDYMLVLDADERLDVATAYHIREVVDADEFDVAYLQFENVAETGTVRRRWIAPRLYRMTPGIRYIGRVHEQVGQGLSEIRTCTIEARVRHYGYQQSVFVGRQKTQRNTDLLERALDDPEARNPLLRSNFLYHHAHMASGEELLARFEAFVVYVREQWPGEPPRVPWITAGIAECARLLNDAGRYEEAGALARELLDRHGSSPLLEFLLARSLAWKGEMEDAEILLRKIIDARAGVAPEHQQYSSDVPLAQGRAHFLPGLIAESRGQQVPALDHFLAAYNEEPEQEVFWSALLCLLARAGHYDDACQLLERSSALGANDSPSLDCLGLALAVLTQSPGRLAFWGEKVRLVAASFGPAARMLQQLQTLGGDPPRLEDFPDVRQAVAARANPVSFRMPQTTRKSELVPSAAPPQSNGTPVSPAALGKDYP